ncbi:unnamed protein product [Adineta ricciae]|uniref:Peptidase C1A papain C-terminal domain-containing protein n=1 Tax=Adineta ricciae TaxID=249248 RepID=A0A813NF69_ADIRI|nr:unnamed protein product [Adineta ricciae]CAF0865352.1 unnamed protein product [Adineta ricciae]
MTFGGLLINRRTRREYRLDGCRRSRTKPVLLNLARPFLSLITRQQLPNVVDLRPYLSPIEEQSVLGSCVGNAVASILEYFHLYTTGQVKIFSRLFIYYNARMMDDEINKRHATDSDSGADLQYALVSLITYGCCEEQFWPFYEHLINIQPTDQAYANGQLYRLKEFSRLSNNVDQLRQCLAQGYPFLMAIKIFPSFASDHYGHIPMPKRYEKPSQYRHAVVCVGYIHSERVFIIRNSHGLSWGDQGYGYLPYDYVTDKVLTQDLWAIKSIQNMMEIPAEQHIAWNNSLTLAKSANPKALAHDESDCDIVYADGDHNNTDEQESEETDSRTHHHHAHAQESLDELPLSSSQQHLTPQQFVPYMPVFQIPQPTLYTPIPNMGSYGYYPTIYPSVPHFPPY